MQDQRTIKWESFKENYNAIINDGPEDSDFDDDFNEDEKPESGLQMISLFNTMPQSRHYTPWGVFDARDPFSPINMYDAQIYLGHFYKFSVHTIPDFVNKMNYMEGVAAWKQIDPHCIAVVVAKAYEWQEVRNIIEKEILQKNDTKTNEEYRREFVKEAYEQLKQFIGPETKVSILLYPNGKTQHIDSSSQEYKYDEELIKLKELNKSIKNSILVIDGEIYND